MRAMNTGWALLLVTQLAQTSGAATIDPLYLATREPGRHALVIGNESYDKHEHIASASQDALAMADNLRRMNYRVMHVPNLRTVGDLEQSVLREFKLRIAPGDIVVFYFSGHGFGYGPFNYLAPVGMPGTVQKNELLKHAIAIEGMETALRSTSPGMMLFLIDACRTLSGFVIDGPASAEAGAMAGTANLPDRFIPKGMAGQPSRDFSDNIITVYAASPGSVALGTDSLSVFTRSLALRMQGKGKEVRSILDEVTADVRVMSGERQAPTVYRGTAADLFLDEIPSHAREVYRETWLATLNSDSYGQVQWFSHRFAVSPYAASARQWLADHAGRKEEAPFTLADPVAVELAWGQRAALVVPASGLAFPRSVLAGADAAPLGDDNALVQRGASAPASTPDTVARDVERVMSRKGAVTIRDYAGRAAPSPDARTVVHLPFGTPITVTGIAKRTPDGVWIEAQTPSSDESVYLKLQPHSLPVTPIDLGQSLEQLMVPARKRIPYLVDSAGIRDAFARLAQASRKVTWVSIATPPVQGVDKVAEQTARIIHVKYLLKQSGVASTRITVVKEATGIASGDVRLRVFGH